MSGDAPAADLLLTGIAQLATAPAPGPLAGAAQGALRVVRDAAVAMRGGRIVWLGARHDWRGAAAREHDLDGRAVIPALVDPHTHAVWAGERLDDFEARARGVEYETLLARGGGIRRTVRATAAADEETLVRLAAPRVGALVASGATVIEVKSGYGLDPDAELRSLRAIRTLAERLPVRLVATYLVHVPPADPAVRTAYVEHVAAEVIPQVARERLATAVDVFVEREAFTVDEAAILLRAARAAGLARTLHADQFHAVGGVELAVAEGARSADHLEASGAAQIAALASAGGRTVGTVLPGVSLHLGLPGAPGRALVDAGVPVAVGTDLNPGSSPLPLVSLAAALAVRLCGLHPAEALVAATANAAAALRLPDAGVLRAGAPADLAVLDGDDWRELVYRLGPVVAEVWRGGRRIA